MPGMMLLVIAAFVAIVIAAAIYSAKKARERREAMARWAAGHGWSFSPEKDRSMMDRYPELGQLRVGDQDRYAYNIVSGPVGDSGRDVLAFDYHYQTVSRDSKGRRRTSSHHFSAVIVRAEVPLRPLLIRSENLFDKLAGFLGFDDIDFESAEFSRRFHVSGPDRRWAFDVLHARTIEFLLEAPRQTLQMDHRHLMTWTGGRWEIDGFERSLALIGGVLDRLPEYVLRQQREVDHA